MAHSHTLSEADRSFREAFEALTVPPAEFTHEAHVRLAYVYLVENDVEPAVGRMREALLKLLEHNGLPLSKFHETLTRAWVLAVRHFMNKSSSSSASDFIAMHPELLDSKIMLTHYSASVLFSPDARASFVEPDLDPIPRKSANFLLTSEGGCLCGAIRYRIDGRPRRTTSCHCLHCRRASAAAFVTWAEYRSSQFELLSGSPSRYESRPQVTRQFCGACGTPLTYQHADAPETIDVTVCSLDDPQTLTPDDHVWCDRMLPWVKIADGLPRYSLGRNGDPR